MKKRSLYSALSVSTLSLLCAAIPATSMAYEAGDILVRLGPALVAPDSSSDASGAVTGDVVDVEDAVGFGISGTWMMTDAVGIELLGAAPFKHDIEGTGALDGLAIGSTKHLPPTLLVNYYPKVSDKFQPYVGIGYNYTLFFNEETSSELDAATSSNTDVSLKDSHGFAFELGVDVPISESISLSATVYSIDIDTVARVYANGAKAATIDVEIDPMVYMLGIGMAF